MNTLRYKLSREFPDKLEEYTAASWDKKRDWISRFEVDPKCAWLEAASTTATFITQANQAKHEWVTLAELSGPRWMNSHEHAKAVWDTDELDKRPHEIAALAALDVEQAAVKRSWRALSDGHEERTQVEARGELNQEQYHDIKSAMAESAGVQPTAPQRPQCPPKVQRLKTYTCDVCAVGL